MGTRKELKSTVDVVTRRLKNIYDIDADVTLRNRSASIRAKNGCWDIDVTLQPLTDTIELELIAKYGESESIDARCLFTMYDVANKGKGELMVVVPPHHVATVIEQLYGLR